MRIIPCTAVASAALLAGLALTGTAHAAVTAPGSTAATGIAAAAGCGPATVGDQVKILSGGVWYWAVCVRWPGLGYVWEFLGPVSGPSCGAKPASKPAGVPDSCLGGPVLTFSAEVWKRFATATRRAV